MNRQIRRMLAKVGLKAILLKRAKVANISIKGSGIGKFRKLNKYELTGLRKIT